jgi:hypothetical protein
VCNLSYIAASRPRPPLAERVSRRARKICAPPRTRSAATFRMAAETR